MLSTLVFILLFCDGSCLGKSESLSATEILEAYQQTMEKSLFHREKSAFKAEQRVEDTLIDKTLEGYTTETYESSQKITFLHNGDHIDYREEHTTFEEGQVYAVAINQYLLNNGYGYSLNQIKDKNIRFLSFYTKSRWKHALGNLGAVGAAFEGRMSGDSSQYLWEVLKEEPNLKLRDEMEVIDGHKTYVLEAKTNHGHYTLWIDPNCGFNLRRCVVCRKDDDLMDGEPLNKPPVQPPSPELGRPRFPTIEHLFTFDSIQIKNFNGLFLPIEGTVTTNEKYSNGNQYKKQWSYKRFDIDLDPDFNKIEGAFAIDIPNGTLARDGDNLAAGIRYMWQNGKIVPIDIQPVPLLGKPLPELKNLGVNLQKNDVTNKTMLVCFFDNQQRPSRNCIFEISKKAKELKEKGIVIIAVQATKIEKAKLGEWIKENNISFPIGTVQKGEEKIRTNWGVKSLPWLILTDKKHVVVAEGFGIDELDGTITKLGEK